MDVAIIGQILNLGLSGVLLIAVWKLWDRLNEVTDILIKMRQADAKERKAIADAVGAEIHPSKVNIPVQSSAGGT